MTAPSPVGIRDVEMAVCARFGLRLEQLQSQNRARPVARPRQIAMFLAREMTGLSLPRIGRHFCRDHTTVLYAARKIARMIAADAGFAAQVAGCRELLAKHANNFPHLSATRASPLADIFPRHGLRPAGEESR